MARRIESADTYFRPIPGVSGAELALTLAWERRDVPPFRPEGLAKEPVATAVVAEGRWIVRCPWCAGAQFAAKADRRFFCISCLNEAVGRQWIAVQWPGEEEIAEIEGALSRRGDPGWMHWAPNKTAAELRAENARGFHHSWAPPRDWVTGEVVSSTIMNTHVRDELDETLPAVSEHALVVLEMFGG